MYFDVKDNILYVSRITDKLRIYPLNTIADPINIDFILNITLIFFIPNFMMFSITMSEESFHTLS